MDTYEIIIVGAGPSGCAAALQLHKLDPDLANNILLLDKAVFPRPKLCAGAVSADGQSALERLGVNFDVPSIPVHVTKFVLPTGCLTFQQPNHFRIIRREEFDHHLFRAARDRGVVTRDGEAVENVIRTADEVIVQTSKGEYRTKVLIAADGANSIVRAKLGLGRIGRVMVGMEVIVPLADASIPSLYDHTIHLYLEPLDHRVPGYCWVFPAVSAGPPLVSLGIMAAPFGNKEATSVKAVFANWLSGLGLDLDSLELKAHPALRYEPRATCSQHRVLFVGDAAGVEPLFGEGITSAIVLGTIAAQAAYKAIHSNDFSFTDYERQIRSSPIGSMMRRRHMVAKRLYSKPKLAHHLLRHGIFLKGVALLSPPRAGVKITWETADKESVQLQSDDGAD
jgi:geranylgeranyl reductase family protein